jgi:ketose-bisphosphate aldolase
MILKGDILLPLVTPSSLFKMIPKDQCCAIGAFNVHNMEYTQAVVKAAEAENTPVILMLGEPILDFAGLDSLANIALDAARRSRIPIAVLLDHGKKMENIERCIELGVSIMVDGSYLPFDDNVRLTREVVKMAHSKGLSVEAELGSLAGIEDINEVAAEYLTDPQAAKELTEATGIDELAIAIGNCHGIYVKPPLLDFKRLEHIHELVDIPLVLHGGSDIPKEMVLEAINKGIKKFNVGTDLKIAFCESLKETLNKEPMPFQPQDTLGPARERTYEVVVQKIRMLRNGCILNN